MEAVSSPTLIRPDGAQEIDDPKAKSKLERVALQQP